MSFTDDAPGPKPCPICDQPGEDRGYNEGLDARRFECDRCGTFLFDPHSRLIPLGDHRLSGLTREQWEHFHRPLSIPYDPREREELLRRAPDDKDVRDKAKRLLLALERKTARPGENVNCGRETDYPLAYARDYQELLYYLEHLSERGLVETVGEDRSAWTGRITPAGWDAIESYKKASPETDRVFVALWFDEQMNDPFRKGIRPALDDDCGYRAIRVDEEDFLGKICDQVIVEIRQSRFVVADVTGQRQAVYFEAGYAQGMGLPVVWSCHEDDIGNVQFDTRQENHIVWNTPENLREKLANRVQRVIGPGPHARRSN